MNDHTLATAAGRSSPAVQTIVRFALASTVGLFLMLCLFLTSRRLGGAFDQPLNSPTILFLGIGMAALAGGLRFAWPRSQQPFASVSSWARLLLPSVAVFLFCYSLSLPGSAPWAVAFLWFLVVIEEGAWWLADLLTLQATHKNTIRANGSALVTASSGNQTPLDLTSEVDSEVDSDVTQQMTRMRDAEGCDLVFGQARAEFTPGARSQIIHLAFCPPLSGSPQITVMQSGGPEAAITVAQAESFGARFDIRLASTARQPESVMIEFEARCVAASEPSKAP
jgi:hypothetical protein